LRFYDHFLCGPVFLYCFFLSELDVDREENSKLGVYWLIKASEQGNVEATDLLKRCLETGQGKVSFEALLFWHILLILVMSIKVIDQT
jgi:TPR repeat protein